MSKASGGEPVSIEDRLTDQQREGARLAAQGCTGRAIAEALGVRQETVSRWRKLPAWQAALDAMLAEARSALSGRLMDMSEAALDRLERLLDYPHDAGVRLRAAVAVLQLAGVARAVSGGAGRGAHLANRSAASAD